MVKEAQKHLASAPGYPMGCTAPAGSTAWQWTVRALGSAGADWERAVQYFAHVLDWQQENGAIPMSFEPGLPDNDFSLLERPYFAPVLWRLFESAPDTELGEELLEWLFPKILQHQLYWYRFRNLNEEGLVSIIHPWEAPLPERDIWDAEEYAVPATWAQPAEARGPRAERRTAQIPTYRQPDALHDYPFLVQDPYLNALLSLSNTFLLQMGQYLRRDVRELMEYQELTVFAANQKLWNPEYGIYCSYDQHQDKAVLSGSLSGWMPLVSSIPDQSCAEAMRLSFEANFLHHDYFLCASNSIYGNRSDFNALSKGALHLWDNWLLYQGLLRFDFDDLAEQIRSDSLTLLSEYGFHLYFNPERSRTGHLGLGTGNHPAAAALFLEFFYKKTLSFEE